MELFEFKEDFRRGQSQRVICVGPRQSVSELLSEDELTGLFGGWIRYRGPDNMEYLGVWGARNVSAMRRIIRERGGEVTVCRERPTGIEIKIRHTARVTNHGKT